MAAPRLPFSQCERRERPINLDDEIIKIGTATYQTEKCIEAYSNAVKPSGWDVWFTLDHVDRSWHQRAPGDQPSGQTSVSGIVTVPVSLSSGRRYPHVLGCPVPTGLSKVLGCSSPNAPASRQSSALRPRHAYYNLTFPVSREFGGTSSRPINFSVVDDVDASQASGTEMNGATIGNKFGYVPKSSHSLLLTRRAWGMLTRTVCSRMGLKAHCAATTGGS